MSTTASPRRRTTRTPERRSAARDVLDVTFTTSPAPAAAASASSSASSSRKRKNSASSSASAASSNNSSTPAARRRRGEPAEASEEAPPPRRRSRPPPVASEDNDADAAADGRSARDRRSTARDQVREDEDENEDEDKDEVDETSNRSKKQQRSSSSKGSSRRPAPPVGARMRHLQRALDKALSMVASTASFDAFKKVHPSVVSRPGVNEDGLRQLHEVYFASVLDRTKEEFEVIVQEYSVDKKLDELDKLSAEAAARPAGGAAPRRCRSAADVRRITDQSSHLALVDERAALRDDLEKIEEENEKLRKAIAAERAGLESASFATSDTGLHKAAKATEDGLHPEHQRSLEALMEATRPRRSR